MSIESPLALSDIGNFYVGGRSAKDDSTAHAYVQYFVPTPPRDLPVLFAHGGGEINGSCWEMTSDGRPGWLSRFLRAGWRCYIMDNVGRGRAVVGQLPRTSVSMPPPQVGQHAWDVFRIGESEHCESGRLFPGGQFPLEFFDGEAPSSAPQWLTDVSPSVAALVAVSRHIGPCAIVSHSGGARFTAEAAGLASDVVVASVLIEPHRLPTGGPPEGISRQLVLGGDNLDRSPIWSIARDSWLGYRDKALAMGAPVELWELPAKGLHGNGHMMMMERNSDAIADLIMKWLESSDI